MSVYNIYDWIRIFNTVLPSINDVDPVGLGISNMVLQYNQIDPDLNHV